MNNQSRSELGSSHNSESERTSPFHPGERQVQQLAGVREEAEKRGQKMLTTKLALQQQDFFHRSPFVVTSHCDADGQPWAGLITGTPGFIQIEEQSNNVLLHKSMFNNPTHIEARPGQALGLLGIDFETRRRNRLNVTVLANEENHWQMITDQGYGNCPKYIQQRHWQTELFLQPYKSRELAASDESVTTLIKNADTFFIASSSGPAIDDPKTRANAWGADISHRGGEAGFLQRTNNRLSFEDYPGNNLFNTLGNLQQNPRCGLLLINFDNGDLLQIAGNATIQHRVDGSHINSRHINIDMTRIRYWTISDSSDF